MITVNVNQNIESFESFCSDRNRIASLAQYDDRVEDSRRVHGEEHRYEVWLKDGWVFGGELEGEDRRYDSFFTVKEMVKAVRAAHRSAS